MLRFNKIVSNNFGPFKGEQIIDFGLKDGVIIFWGDNGRGKTSLLNLFRYALFGFVKTRHGTSYDYFALCNIEAVQEGVYGFSVRLEMTNKSDKYVLIREVKLREGVISTDSNEDLIEHFFLKKNGNVLSGPDRDHELNIIMPKDISRFFLFDGELLQEYEELLDDRSGSGLIIKESIEKILGMPMLTNSLTDVSDLESEYTTEHNKAAQNDKNTSDFANAIAILTDKINGHKQEKKHFAELLANQNIELEAIKQQMEKNERLREHIALQRANEKTLNGLKIRRNELLNEIQEYMKDIWKSSIQSRIAMLLDETNICIKAMQDKESCSEASQYVIDELQKSIHLHKCQTCERDLDNDLASILEEKLRDLRNATTILSVEEQAALGNFKRRQSTLLELSFQDMSGIVKSKVRDVEKINYDIIACETSLKDTQAELKIYGDYDPSVEELANQFSRCKSEIELSRRGISDAQEVIDQSEKERNSLNLKVSKISKNKDVLKATEKLKICKMIKAIFNEGINQYRLKLKMDVEKDASDLFSRMSADEDYEKLNINDNYGLEIIHKIGIKVPGRSAAFEHVVALSLIGALHKNAPLQGPVIMDTPFGRLDNQHKENITRCLPMLANQVFLLVYSGEIDPQKTRELLGGYLANEFKFDRISSFHTKIS